jgi:hypothetical protein
VALAGFAALKGAIERPVLRLMVNKPGGSSAANALRHRWAAAVDGGSNPTAAAAVSRTTAGAVAGLSARTGPLWLAQLEAWRRNAPTSIFVWILLVDRLAHQGGLSGTATGEQTTNLPTASLTRFTDGEGVMAALEVYTAVGTGQTCTIRYTNQAGVANRVSPALNLVNVASGATSIFALQNGDTGVRSIQGFTLSATTGTAGNMGLVLFKPLVIAPSGTPAFTSSRRMTPCLGWGAPIAEIHPEACLQPYWYSPSADEQPQFITLRLAEG